MRLEASVQKESKGNGDIMCVQKEEKMNILNRRELLTTFDLRAQDRVQDILLTSVPALSRPSAGSQAFAADPL